MKNLSSYRADTDDAKVQLLLAHIFKLKIKRQASKTYLYPRFLHMTLASFSPNLFLQTAPHSPSCSTSTLPSPGWSPPTRRTDRAPGGNNQLINQSTRQTDVAPVTTNKSISQQDEETKHLKQSTHQSISQQDEQTKHLKQPIKSINQSVTVSQSIYHCQSINLPVIVPVTESLTFRPVVVEYVTATLAYCDVIHGYSCVLTTSCTRQHLQQYLQSHNTIKVSATTYVRVQHKA